MANCAFDVMTDKSLDEKLHIAVACGFITYYNEYKEFERIYGKGNPPHNIWNPVEVCQNNPKDKNDTKYQCVKMSFYGLFWHTFYFDTLIPH